MALVNNDINNLLTYSKKMVESLDNKSYDPTRKNMMVLSFAAMICYYGMDNVDAIYNAFNTKMAIGTRNGIMHLLENRHSLNENLKNDLISGNVTGLCDYRCEYVTHNNFGFYTVNPHIFVIDSGNINYVDLTELIVHEINHVVNTYNRNIIIKDSNYYLRCGLQLTNLNENWSKNVSVEESINVLQAADIMNIVRMFSKYKVEDENIAIILKNIRRFHRRESTGIGYESIVGFVRGLYNDTNFRRICTDSRIKGNIEDVIDYFNSRTYNGGFDELSERLDNLYNYNDKNERYNVKKLVKSYLDK